MKFSSRKWENIPYIYIHQVIPFIYKKKNKKLLGFVSLKLIWNWWINKRAREHNFHFETQSSKVLKHDT